MRPIVWKEDPSLTPGSVQFNSRRRRRTSILAAAFTVITLALVGLYIGSWTWRVRRHTMMAGWVVEYGLRQDSSELTLIDLGHKEHIELYMLLHDLERSHLRPTPEPEEVQRFKCNGMVIYASRGAVRIDIRHWDHTPRSNQSSSSSRVGWRQLGLERSTCSELNAGQSVHHVTLRSPLWVLMLLTAAYPMSCAGRRLTRRVVQRRRRRIGCCTACGYDLTGNSNGRCPECGKATAGGSEGGVPPSRRGG